MQVVQEKQQTWLVLKCAGRLDATGAKTIAGALDEALAGGSHAVELDISGVNYLSSAGIRVLVSYSRAFSELRGSFWLTHADDRIGRLLEMTGLYHLLDSPVMDTGSADLQRIAFSGWSLSRRILEPDGSFGVRSVQPQEPDAGSPRDEPAHEILPFPPSVLAFGTGALGYDAGECRGRYGPFLAAAGYAAFRPGDGETAADFVEYAEAFIPRLHALSGTVLSGTFSNLFMFESDSAPPDMKELAGAFLSAAGVPAAGFVLAAECEAPETVCPVRGGPVAGDGKRLCLALIAGLVTGKGGSGAAGADGVIRAGAAFFPYHPLRRSGRVKLKETADQLFSQELLDVIDPSSPAWGDCTGGLRLLRGLAWMGPVRETR